MGQSDELKLRDFQLYLSAPPYPELAFAQKNSWKRLYQESFL